MAQASGKRPTTSSYGNKTPYYLQHYLGLLLAHTKGGSDTLKLSKHWPDDPVGMGRQIFEAVKKTYPGCKLQVEASSCLPNTCRRYLIRCGVLDPSNPKGRPILNGHTFGWVCDAYGPAIHHHCTDACHIYIKQGMKGISEPEQEQDEEEEEDDDTSSKDMSEDPLADIEAALETVARCIGSLRGREQQQKKRERSLALWHRDAKAKYAKFAEIGKALAMVGMKIELPPPLPDLPQAEDLCDREERIPEQLAFPSPPLIVPQVI